MSNMSYFERDDIIQIKVKDREEAGSVELSPRITAGLDDQNEIIGIEIIGASKYLRDNILQSAQSKLLKTGFSRCDGLESHLLPGQQGVAVRREGGKPEPRGHDRLLELLEPGPIGKQQRRLAVRAAPQAGPHLHAVQAGKRLVQEPQGFSQRLVGESSGEKAQLHVAPPDLRPCEAPGERTGGPYAPRMALISSNR